MKVSISKFLLVSIIALAPCTSYSRSSGRYSKTDYQGLAVFCGIASIPFLFWAYKRYQEDQRSTETILAEIQNSLNTIVDKHFWNDFLILEQATSEPNTVETIVHKSYPGYRFPFLSYTFDAKQLVDEITQALWRINRRIDQNRPEDQTHMESLKELKGRLSNLQEELYYIIEEVTSHPHYDSEVYSRESDEFSHSHSNYGLSSQS